MNLGGRNALVTGVSRRAGIGYAVARRLREAGAAVFLQGWTPHDEAQPWGAEPGGTEAVAGELDVPFAEVDFADAAAPEELVAAAADRLGPLDILVVNHSRSGHGRLAELTAAEIDAFLHENVRAALLLVREFAGRHDDSRPGGAGDSAVSTAQQVSKVGTASRGIGTAMSSTSWPRETSSADASS